MLGAERKLVIVDALFAKPGKQKKNNKRMLVAGSHHPSDPSVITNISPLGGHHTGAGFKEPSTGAQLMTSKSNSNATNWLNRSPLQSSAVIYNNKERWIETGESHCPVTASLPHTHTMHILIMIDTFQFGLAAEIETQRREEVSGESGKKEEKERKMGKGGRWLLFLFGN